jgi:hypothetical protein
LAWVVMPNHVHVLFQPMEGWTMGPASWRHGSLSQESVSRLCCRHRRDQTPCTESGIASTGIASYAMNGTSTRPESTFITTQ